MLLGAGDALSATTTDDEDREEVQASETAEQADERRGTRRWLTGPMNTGGEEYYGVRVEGTWDQEVSRVLDGAAANDWSEGRIGS